MEFGDALDFGFITVVYFAVADTFSGAVSYALFEAFSFVRALATLMFFAGFPDFTSVLAFTGEFFQQAVYTLIGVLDFTGVVSFTGVLPVADLFFVPCDTAFAGYALFRRRGTVIRTETFFWAMLHLHNSAIQRNLKCSKGHKAAFFLHNQRSDISLQRHGLPTQDIFSCNQYHQKSFNFT